MDSLTQIVLGAGVGEALLGKKAGNKTILWGAILGTVPDLDVIPSLFMDTVDKIEFHRGFSHSLLFFFLSAPLFGWLIHKIYKGKIATWREWTVFAFWVLFTHALLDCFTTWGTRLFFPSDFRVAFNTIFVVDPLYTLPFLACIIALLFYDKESTTRQRLAYAGLIISSAYLLLTFLNKYIVDSVFEDALAKQNIEYTRFSTKPSPLNNILWFATIEAGEGYYLGYYSLLDRDREISFQYIAGNHALLGELKNNEQIKTLLHIADGYYCVEQTENNLLLHDLRFGQATNFFTGQGEFVFSFSLYRENENGEKTVHIAQKEYDMSKVTSETFQMLWRRMLGEKSFKAE